MQTFKPFSRVLTNNYILSELRKISKRKKKLLYIHNEKIEMKKKKKKKKKKVYHVCGRKQEVAREDKRESTRNSN